MSSRRALGCGCPARAEGLRVRRATQGTVVRSRAGECPETWKDKARKPPRRWKNGPWICNRKKPLDSCSGMIGVTVREMAQRRGPLRCMCEKRRDVRWAVLGGHWGSLGKKGWRFYFWWFLFWVWFFVCLFPWGENDLMVFIGGGKQPVGRERLAVSPGGKTDFLMPSIPDKPCALGPFLSSLILTLLTYTAYWVKGRTIQKFSPFPSLSLSDLQTAREGIIQIKCVYVIFFEIVTSLAIGHQQMNASDKVQPVQSSHSLVWLICKWRLSSFCTWSSGRDHHLPIIPHLSLHISMPEHWVVWF